MPINRSLAWLHVLEAIGAFIVAILMVVASDLVGDTVVPWFLAVVPALFGVMLLFVARQVARRNRWRVIYVVWAQSWVITAAVVGLVFSGHPVLWVAIVMAIAGIALAIVAQKEETAVGSTEGEYG